MHTSTITTAAATPGVHDITVLGHDVNGWAVAMICALVAAVLYEISMALTSAVTLRIPFLILQVARISVSKGYRAYAYEGWKGELWAILRTPGKNWLRRFIKGMGYSTQLALFGARATMRIKAAAQVNKGVRADKAEKPVVAEENRFRYAKASRVTTILLMLCSLLGGVATAMHAMGAAIDTTLTVLVGLSGAIGGAASAMGARLRQDAPKQD
ncbi:hypothetical protein ACIHJG_39755 [Streptomyces sp. NPDC052415]|uniref:hypothetical protein n=1 Tax=Streptomyces sp. NPDC052415 TaxID=3365690 RepID=UPI0037D94CA3